MECKWDKKLLWKLFKDKDARKELQGLYISLFDPFNLFQSERHFLKNTITMDTAYLQDHDFAYDAFEYAENLPKLPKNKDQFKLKISPKDALELTYEFYQSTPKEIYQAFLKFFEKRYSHLKFTKDVVKTFYTANTYVSKTHKCAFVELDNQNNIKTASTLVHECGHVINAILTDYEDYGYQNDFTSETTSIFMELIALDFWSRYQDLRRDINHQREIFYSTFCEDASLLVDKYVAADAALDIVSDIPDFYPLSSEEFLELLQENLEADKSKLKEIFKNPASAILPYTYSSLIAFEFYHLYQTDPEYAIMLYKEFIKIKGQTPEEIDYKIKELGIFPTENIDTFSRTLKW